MTTVDTATAGEIVEVSGALVRVRTTVPLTLGEVAFVGADCLIAEVIALDGDVASLQVYEETGGLSPGAPVVASGGPLAVDLGPGLLGAVFDGIQRPLDRLAAAEGDFLGRGQRMGALDADRRGSSIAFSRRRDAAASSPGLPPPVRIGCGMSSPASHQRDQHSRPPKSGWPSDGASGSRDQSGNAMPPMCRF
jgi:hypothetical protein